MKARSNLVFNKFLPIFSLFALSGAVLADPPIVSISAPTFANGGTVVTLTGSAEDPDGTALSYLWTQLDGEQVTITNADQAVASFVAPLVSERETFEFSLTVTDEQNEDASEEFILEVGTVEPPVAQIYTQPATVLEGSTVTLAGQGFFLGNPIENVSWQQLSGPTVPLSSAAEEEVTFVAPELDNTDGTNEKVELEFQLTVFEEVNNIAVVDTVIITVEDNSIVGLDGFITTLSVPDENAFGVRMTAGELVALLPQDPSVVATSSDFASIIKQPREMPVGLVGLVAKTAEGGTAGIEIKLTEPLPDDYSMYSYSDDGGWEELAANQFSINGARDSVTLTLQDVVAAPRAADINGEAGLVEFVVGPGQRTTRVAADAVVGGGTIGLWMIVVIGLLRLFRTSIGPFRSLPKIFSRFNFHLKWKEI